MQALAAWFQWQEDRVEQKNTSIATLQIVGGRACLDFANTVAARRGRWGPDLLAAYDDLMGWAERIRLLDRFELAELRERSRQDPQAADAALASAKMLREAIYQTFSALAAGSDPADSELDAIAQRAMQARSRQRLAGDRRQGYGWSWALPAELGDIAGRVAADATTLLTDSSRLGRIKECFGQNCGWLFLDVSRNGRRRWCSDADCGTPARVTRFRARMRSAADR